MSWVLTHRAREKRGGVAAVELAVLLPFLAFMFVLAVDYSRVFYFSLTIQNAARAGAYYGCLTTANSTNTTGIQSAALADASNLAPTPTVSSVTGIDANSSNIVTVTVTYTFQTITNYPWVPSSTTLSRSVTMRVLPLGS